MRLYYFTKEIYGLQAIHARRLKVARLEELNDPFELVGIALPPAVRIAFQKFRTTLGRKNGIVCMSETWHHPLMWAHYADTHKGICLGFDANPEHFTPVEYVEQRPTLGEFGLANLADLSEQHMRRLLHMKFKAWDYEREHRAYIALRDKDPVSGHYFTDFGEHLALREVIVGMRSTLSHRHLQQVIGAESAAVETIKARAAFQTFDVVRNRSRKMWPGQARRDIDAT